MGYIKPSDAELAAQNAVLREIAEAAAAAGKHPRQPVKVELDKPKAGDK